MNPSYDCLYFVIENWQEKLTIVLAFSLETWFRVLIDVTNVDKVVLVDVTNADKVVKYVLRNECLVY